MAQVVVDEFKSICEAEQASPPIGAIKALTAVLVRSSASTVMELGDELRGAGAALVAHAEQSEGPNASIPVKAACEMFLKYVTSSSGALLMRGDFEAVKGLLVQRGERLSQRLVSSRERLAKFGFKFVCDGQTVLVHGYSRAVIAILQLAAEQGRRFEVIATEGRPNCSGYAIVEAMTKVGVPVSLVVDSAIGLAVEKADIVLVGAAGIVESGGLANSVGTYPLALVAQANKKPVYVAAESFKFSRIFPLKQSELEAMDTRPLAAKQDSATLVTEHRDEMSPETLKRLQNPEDKDVFLYNATTDYTPPECITLIITDIGVLTPAAISDELIKLHQ